MITLLPDLKNKLLLAFVLVFSSFSTFAQCPVAATCTPGTAPTGNHIFGMGIMNVTFGSINNSTSGVADGYRNYSCTIGNAITAGVLTPVSITTNNNVNENVRVWIDYDNNGTFDPVAELAFSSDNKKLHTGSVIVPGTAVTNQPLRMRVSADYVAAPIPTPCSTPQYSQVEDYKVTVSANASLPDADFTSNSTVTCSGLVAFTDNSQNLPTSWTWNFGDGSTDTTQNPTHTYTTPGTYNVTLIACNASGCDTITKTNYITYNVNLVRPASCTPVTSNHCCNYGITNFTLGSLTNTSANGAAGYEDFTCTKSVTVTEGWYYPLSITTGTLNNNDTRLWVDFNNNGVFEASEKVFEDLNGTNPQANLVIPSGAVHNTPLRMRVISDFAGSGFTACSGVTLGQAEDYSITILPNSAVPIADFESNKTVNCNPAITFYDRSLNFPTSWKWYFGDGDSSSLQNPIHQYTSSGNYNVTLISCNSLGCDTIIKTNYINLSLPCLPYCPSTGNRNSLFYISGVQIGLINNQTGKDANGYGDYTHLSTSLNQGNSYPITIKSGFPTYIHDFDAWIDFNRNGIFESNEQVVRSDTSVEYSGVVSVPSTASVGMARMRVIISDNILPTSPCTNNHFNAEVEDYTIYIGTGNQPLIANFVSDKPVSCYGDVQFHDVSMNKATSWLWDFGDGSTSALQNPVHTYSSTGQYTVKLRVCNAQGCDSITKVNFINYDPNAAFCGLVNMPATGVAPVIIKCSGTLFDSGGPYKSYGYNEDGVLTIAPVNAGSVTLAFSYFDFENSDYLYVYDGPDLNSPLIGRYSGTSLYNDTITSTYGAITLRMESNGSWLRPGMVVNWNCNQSTARPVAQFVARFDSICTGEISFQDISANGASTWLWDFGDGTTSTQRYPTHNYQVNSQAKYDVTLVVCNTFGCDTIVKPNFVDIRVPCLQYCPSDGHDNSSVWISNVKFGNINNSSTDEHNGYRDYSYLSTPLTIGSSTQAVVSVAQGYRKRVKAWIDFNQDGIFQQNELVLDDISVNNPPLGYQVTGNIIVPSNAYTGRTRMRVSMSDGASFGPCSLTLNWGETEDYAVEILPNTSPVVSNFTISSIDYCSGDVQFVDNSLNGADSWHWDFGDGTTSTLQNPFHSYATTTSGSYDVTLISCKGTQCDTTTKSSYINIDVPCINYCISNGHSNIDQWISNVTIGAFSNSTAQELNGYGYYENLSASGIIGSPATAFSVELGVNNIFRNVYAWIDFNHDGIFQSSEKVFVGRSQLNSGVNKVTGNFAIPASALVGKTRMRIILNNLPIINDPCINNLSYGEVEDYSIDLQYITVPPVASFTSDTQLPCSGEVHFSESTTNLPTSWQWDFGDGASSTQQKPTHLYQNPGIYTVSLIACNGTGCDTLIKPNYINYDPSRPVCSQVTMPTTGGRYLVNLCSGNIYDSGGPNQFYQNNENSIVTIAPKNAANVVLTFSKFKYWGGDFLKVYDGFDTAATLLGSYTWANLPNNGAPIVSSGKAITLQSITNGYSRDSGFVASWYCNPDSVAPTSAFSDSVTYNCTGVVFFKDQSSLGLVDNWYWDFGNGRTSNNPNPTHGFTAAGTYAVNLRVCNQYGCDSITKNIVIQLTSPMSPPSCSPITSTSCCDYGISNVKLNKLNHSSGNATEGYKDFTCHFVDTLSVGSSYTLQVKNSGTQPEKARAWIDFNSNGTFDSNEEVLTSDNDTLHTATFTIPSSLNGGVAVRMRVASTDNTRLAPYPCSNLRNGQVEDYTVYLDGPVGIKNKLPKLTFSVYPNPSTGQVTIKTEATKAQQLEVLNVLGQVLQTKQLQPNEGQEHQLNLSHLPRGVYMIRVTSNNGTTGIEKLILD